MSLVSLAQKTEEKFPLPQYSLLSSAFQTQRANHSITPLQSTIPTLNSAQVTPLTNREVRVHISTPSERENPLQDVENPANLLTEKLATKKKKKKRNPSGHKVNPETQAALCEQLGSSFALTKLDNIAANRVAQTKTPIFEQFPELNNQEQQLLCNLIKEYSALENINLFEVFLSELTRDWELTDKYSHLLSQLHNECAQQLKSFHDEKSIIKELFLLYLFHYEEIEVNIEKKFDENIYRTATQLISYLNECSKLLNRNLNVLQISFEMKKSCYLRTTKIKKEYEQKHVKVFNKFNLYIDKINLLAKCLSSKNFVSAFISKKLTAWSESDLEKTPQECMAQAIKFASFVQNFLNRTVKTGILGNIDPIYWKFLKAILNIIDADFSKTSIANFFSSYKECSRKNLMRLIALVQYLDEAHNNEKFTYAKYCEENKFPVKINHSQEKFISILYHTTLSTHVLDGWLNHIHHAVSKHILSDFEGTLFNPIEAYVQRLITMLELVTTEAKLDNDEITTPLVREICDPIEELIETAIIEIKTILEKVSLQETYTNLKNSFDEPPFRLLESLSHVEGIQRAIESFSISHLRLDQILATLLDEVKKAKENSSESLNHHKLKSEIEDHLLSKCMYLSAYIMIISDTKLLHSKSRSSDTLHLLPNSLAELLSLKGFDEIFLKAHEVPESPSTNPSALQEPQKEISTKEIEENKKCHPPLSENENKEKSKKEAIKGINTIGQRVITQDEAINQRNLNPKDETAPVMQDFYRASDLTLMDKLLHRMQCHLDRIKGGHRIYRQDITGKIVVVPGNLEKKGTLKSIGNQAFEAQPDFKKD